MADLNIVRKPGPTLWPWLIGLVVLGLLIWAIAELVNTDRDNATMEEADADGGPVAAAVAPGAASPPAGAPVAEQTPALTPAPLAALMPLGTQDVGQQVSATGEVLTQPADGGFWLRTENQAVIWVKGAQRVKQGQQVQSLVGIIQQASPGAPGSSLDPEIASSKEGKNLAFVPGLILDTSSGANGAPPAGRKGSGVVGGHGRTQAGVRGGSAKKASEKASQASTRD